MNNSQVAKRDSSCAIIWGRACKNAPFFVFGSLSYDLFSQLISIVTSGAYTPQNILSRHHSPMVDCVLAIPPTRQDGPLESLHVTAGGEAASTSPLSLLAVKKLLPLGSDARRAPCTGLVVLTCRQLDTAVVNLFPPCEAAPRASRPACHICLMLIHVSTNYKRGMRKVDEVYLQMYLRCLSPLGDYQYLCIRQYL